ncbi:putative efflux protein, MATE family [Desulfonispora thiosulfatigenes DSM 11270]|uniref:Multidrug export protein MepA n=1 Tax=Desulfonispora thiosulfatigenes DSM 11270 TaxID=656914 RepID=A0A1W1UFE2_DESTI|nr:MATE family efflux transporter [Desulfonispora thiosulfatigenes]SMB79504.1 putative efflux protein, MATE family [Desulfonispora thiosulfatigenes DSM 11270]
MKKNSRELGEEKISKLLFKFSIPAIIGTLVNALYNIVDRMFIGNGVGSLGIAGLTIGFPIMMISMAFSMLIGVGTTALISIRLGENDQESAESIMGTGAMGLVLMALLLSALSITFLEPLLKLFGATAANLPYAKSYMQIILLGNIFASIGFGMNNFIRAEGNPKIAMFTMLLGAVINVILDYIFIFIFNWGIQGAAFATVLAQAVSAAWVLVYFLGGKSLLKLKKKNLKLDTKLLLQIVAIGSAPFAMQLASSLLNLIMNNSLKVYGGDTAIAGMGIVFSTMMLLMMPVIGISQGVQPIIGYNYGAQKYDRVKEALKSAMYAATTIAVLGFVLTRLYSVQLVTLFNPEDKELIKFGSKAIHYFFIMLPVVGFQIVGANYYQAVGKPRAAMILTLSRQILFLIPLLLILPRFYGLEGILYAGPTADFCSFILTFIFIAREFKFLSRPSLTEVLGDG